MKKLRKQRLTKETHISPQIFNGTHEPFPLNPEQKQRIDEARADYAANRYYGTDELFNELLNN